MSGQCRNDTRAYFPSIEGRDGGAEAGGRLDAFEARERAPHLRLCDAGEDAVAEIAVFGLNGREE